MSALEAVDQFGDGDLGLVDHIRFTVTQLRYNYRAYPDATQRCALASAFGCARVVWNDCLRDRREAHAAGLAYVKSAELSRLRITQAKRTEERSWLADVSAVVLQQSLRDLDAAYKNFFDSLTGKRQGPQGRPSPLQVEEGHPAVDPPEHQRLLPPGQRQGVCGQGRQPQGHVVAPAAGRTHVPDRHQGQLRPLLPQLRRGHRAGHPPRAGVGGRYRPQPVRRPEDRQPALPAPGGEETQAPSAGAIPQGQGIEEPGQGPYQGRTPARQGGQPAPGLAPQGIHADHSRQPSGVRGRPRGVRSRPHPACQVRARRGMVCVRQR